MTKFEIDMETISKAMEALEAVKAENEALEGDIIKTQDRLYDQFLKELLIIRDNVLVKYGLFNLKSTYSFKTGLKQDYYNVYISFDNCRDIYITYGMSRTNADRKFHNMPGPTTNKLVAEIIKVKENVIENIKSQILDVVSPEIDEAFTNAVKQNDKLLAQWKELCVESKPFYKETWSEDDLVEALKNAGKSLSRESIDKLKSRFLISITSNEIVSRKELLCELAKEVN